MQRNSYIQSIGFQLIDLFNFNNILMTEETIFKVLTLISLRKTLIIPKLLLSSTSGFGRLRREGYLIIHKTDRQFSIVLSLKGTAFLKAYRIAHNS